MSPPKTQSDFGEKRQNTKRTPQFYRSKFERSYRV